jgi:transcriptional regulator with XRE-family HTH domain
MSGRPPPPASGTGDADRALGRRGGRAALSGPASIQPAQHRRCRRRPSWHCCIWRPLKPASSTRVPEATGDAKIDCFAHFWRPSGREAAPLCYPPTHLRARCNSAAADPSGAGVGPQEQLAERSGLSVRAISSLEHGWVRSPRGESVRLLAAALGLADRGGTLFEEAARQVTVQQTTAAESPPVPEAPVPCQLPPDVADFTVKSVALSRRPQAVTRLGAASGSAPAARQQRRRARRCPTPDAHRAGRACPQGRSGSRAPAAQHAD